MNKQLQQTFESVQNLPLSDQITLITLMFQELLKQPQAIEAMFQSLRLWIDKNNKTSVSQPSMVNLIGMGRGSFDTPEQADTFIRAEREAWN